MIAARRHSPFTILLFLATLISGCEKPVPQQGEPPPSTTTNTSPASPDKAPTLPVSRTLTDSRGRPLAGRIIGKSTTDLFVIREADALHFQIPIHSLSSSDQAFARRLPDQMPPSDFSPANAPRPDPTPSTSGKDAPYVIQRQEEIGRLSDEIASLEKKLSGLNPTGIGHRSTLSQIDRNRKEVTKLKQAIDRYLEDNP